MTRRDPVVSAALAVGGGVCWGVCFGIAPPFGLAFLALVPLASLAFRRRAGWWGGVHGTVAWLVALPWIVPTLRSFGGIPTPGAVGLLLLMAAYLGAYDGLWAFLVGRWGRDRPLPVTLGLGVGLWMLLEIVRGRMIGGFPWNPAATAWIDLDGALPLASWIGALGVSGCVVAVPMALALSWRRRLPEAAAAVVLGIGILLVTASRWAGPEESGPFREGLALSVLQPDHRIVLDDAAAVWAQYRDLIEMSRAECRDHGPRVLFWPESAAWPHSWPSSPRLRADVAELAALGCPVVLNSTMPAGDRVYNSALFVGADGIAGRYDKRHLVPFGETVPFADVLPFVGRIAREAGDFAAGEEASLLEIGTERVAMAICFEVVFSRAVLEQVRGGGTILATVTNDAWYGPTAAPHQHFRSARFRAAETGRPLVRAALTGISALVDPRGRVAASLSVGEKGVLRGQVRGHETRTLYVRAPWLPVVVALLLVGFVIFPGPRRIP